MPSKYPKEPKTWTEEDWKKYRAEAAQIAQAEEDGAASPHCDE